MAQLLKVRNLIQRYQASDPILYQIFDGILTDLENSVTNASTTTPVDANRRPLDWGPMTDFGGVSVAGDFLASGGEVWNVIAVGAFIRRRYSLSSDGSLMLYIVDVTGSTIVTGGLAQQLAIKLPPGYVSTTNLGGVSGWGYMAINALGETPLLDIQGGTPDRIFVFRPNFAFFPASAGGFSIRIGTIFPCAKQSADVPVP